MNNPKLSLNLVGIFLFASAIILVCYVGLPIDFNADYITFHSQAVHLISNHELIRNVLTPFTPAWFYPDNNEMQNLRPLQVLLYNNFFRLVPYSNVPFHILAAIGHGFLALLCFGLIMRWTNSKLLAWLAIILYASFPSNYFMLASSNSGDFQYYVSILSLSALLIFGALTLNRMSNWHFVIGVASLIVLVWIAIKLKSTEKIMPFVCLAFLVVHFKQISSKVGSVKYLILVMACLSMMILVVPFRSLNIWNTRHPAVASLEKTINIEPSTQKDKKTFSFSTQNLIQRTFYVSGGENPFVTVVRRKIPRSFSENYGFLCWFFWPSLLLSAFFIFRTKTVELPGVSTGEEFSHYFWLILIWFSVTIAGFANGADLTEIRLLNFAYVPAILLLPMSCRILETRFFSSQKKRFYFRIVFAGLVILTCVNNFILLGKLIRHFGGMQDTLVRIERDVYQAFYKEEPVSEHLYRRHQDLEGKAVFVDWYEHPSDWFPAAKARLNEHKQLFFYTQEAQSERLKAFQETGYDVTLWKEYDLLDSSPFIFRAFQGLAKLKEKLGRRNKMEIFVYRIQPKL